MVKYCNDGALPLLEEALRYPSSINCCSREAPDMRIADVAVTCGFGDYNYFIALFSRTVGESPYAYKKRFLRNTDSY